MSGDRHSALAVRGAHSARAVVGPAARWLAFAGLLFCAACPSRPTYPECKLDEDCAQHGQVCASGFCRECRDDASCATVPGRPLCRDAVCVAKPECAADADCGSGRRCAQNKCVAECAEPKDCAAGKTCTNGRCAEARCSSDADCTEGSACVDGACRQESLGPQGTHQFGSCKLAPVTFGFDDANLTAEARQALSDVWQCLQHTSYRRVLLTGHTDERGTTEYNLALGERRADAVKKYLLGLGADARRLKTASFGKERPLDLGHDDAAWARNRRVELSVEP
jgi:peptidoglycan-associated lipoprotein